MAPDHTNDPTRYRAEQTHGPARGTVPPTEIADDDRRQVRATLDVIVAALAEIKAVLTGAWKPLYTVEEVASLTGRSPYTVRRWVAERRITAQRVQGTGPKSA